MSHYFSKNLETKSKETIIEYTYKDIAFKFKTDHGVFSKNHVDDATDFLLHQVLINQGERVLDLGCGYGVIGVVVSKIHRADVTMVDVNERAIHLAKVNLELNNQKAQVFLSDGFNLISNTYHHIVSNPPIRIGKKAMYQLFLDAKKHLVDQGSLWIVMHKKHGALSAIDFLGEHYRVKVLKKQKGFHIIQCVKHVD